MNEPIISVSGLRGIVGQSLTPEIAVRYALAFASELPHGKLVLTRDGRASGQAIVEALASGLATAGRDVIDAGIAATPTTGVLIRQLGAAGGIQVSASHNPAEYNGLKLFSSEGRVLPAAEGAKVLKRYRQGLPPAKADRAGRVDRLEDTWQEHLTLVLATVDAARIRRRAFRVFLNSNHGAGSLLGLALLRELGCHVSTLDGEKPDGRFDHVPEPTAENLAHLLPKVAGRYDVTFCQDPDADRLAVIDADGRYVGEEYTLAMCVDHRLRSTRGAVVINCSTSRMSQDLATKYDVPCIVTPVGEANVVDGMLAHRAIIGGEGNGGVIDPRVGLVRDSFVGIAQILDAMASREMTVAELANELPRYEIVKTKAVLAADKLPHALSAVESRFPDAIASRQDGLRLDWPGKWLLVRGSNTEPIVRIIAEAETLEEAGRLCQAASDAVGN